MPPQLELAILQLAAESHTAPPARAHRETTCWSPLLADQVATMCHMLKLGDTSLLRRLDHAAARLVTELTLGSVLGGGGAAPSPNEPDVWSRQSAVLQSAAQGDLCLPP